MVERPAFVRHWSEIEDTAPFNHPATGETFAVGARFSSAFGLSRLGIHHERLEPGCRTSIPHAERDEEEFVLVIEGEPDLWLDGRLHRLRVGEGVGFPAGTGIAHTFINNTDTPVRLLVVGEASRENSRAVYPLDPQANAWLAARGKLWEDPPRRQLGGHDGRPDRRPRRTRG